MHADSDRSDLPENAAPARRIAGTLTRQPTSHEAASCDPEWQAVVLLRYISVYPNSSRLPSGLLTSLSVFLTMETTLNLYGDRPISTTGAHGIDVASQRLDPLDKEALEQVLQSAERLSCIDLGCGFGWQGVRFAFLGAITHLFDLMPESELVKSVRNFADLPISHLQCDLRSIPQNTLPECIDLAFSQRFIHYLTYSEASKLIGIVYSHLSPGAKFYISASGLDSELGKGYLGEKEKIEERFSPLSPAIQSKHNIFEPVCLYREGELADLFISHRYVERQVWKSPFGNIKGVFQKEV